MKKALLFTSVFFMLVSMTSCKKLLGLDPESLLSKDPWVGDKVERYENGEFKASQTISNWSLEFDKNTHHFKFKSTNTGEGQWSYDKKNKILTLNFENGMNMELKVIILKKKKLVASWISPNNSQIEFKFYFKRE